MNTNQLFLGSIWNKKKEDQCCPNCPPISADVDNTLECRADGLYASGGGGGTVTGGENGITLDGAVLKLGGPLTEPTTITGDAATEKIIFTGVSEQIAGDVTDAFVQISADAGAGFGPIALGITATDTLGGIGTGIWIQDVDSAMNITNAIQGINISANNYGMIIDAAGGFGIDVAAESTGISATSATHHAVFGVSNGTVEAGRFIATAAPIGFTVENNASSTTSIGLQVWKRNSFDANLVATAAVFKASSNFVFTPNYVTAVNINAPSGSGDSSTNTPSTQLRSKWPALGGGTAYSQTEIWGWAGGFPGAAVQSFTLSHNAGGRLGIASITSPTARLHLPAGTATAATAPLKLTTGTALTTPEDGAIEYHSSHLYFTIGSTRFQLDQQFGSTAVSNGLTFLSGTARLGQATFGGETAMITGTREIVTQNGAQGLHFRVMNTDSTYTKISPSGIHITGALGEFSNSIISFSYDDNPFAFNMGYDPSFDGFQFNSNKVMSFNEGIQIEPNGNGNLTPGDPLTYPLKFVSYTVMTTPEAGAFEYDGTNLFFTRVATRESIFTGNSGATAPATTTAAVVSTDYYGTNTAVLTTPNSWTAVVIGGTTYKIPLYT